MEVTKFIEEYSSAKSKMAFLKKHCVNTYIPYLIKAEDCAKLISSSMYTKTKEGNEFYNPNRVLYDFLFSIRLIQRYTDIDIEDPFKAYDELRSHGLMSEIEAVIPSDEVVEYTRIAQGYMEDARERENNVAQYIKNLLLPADTEWIKQLVETMVKDDGRTK